MASISGLQDRLRRLKAEPPKPAKQSAGLYARAHVHPLDANLLNLDREALGRMGWAEDWPPLERVLFLDTETTGLSGGAGTVAFLTGVGYTAEDGFVVEQFLMRDYADEAEMLHRVAARLQQARAVVTFNGRAFDMPLLCSRFTMCRMREEWRDVDQLDLLLPARRLWKKRLGSVRLSHLEEEILRCGREDDLPGAEVPDRYFAYLKSGDMGLLEDVLEHNHLDVLSLYKLLLALNAAYARPEAQTERADLFSMGRTLYRQGDQELAKKCYCLAGAARPLLDVSALRGEKIAGEANMALAAIYRREGDYERAYALWRETAARGQMGGAPYVEMAKHCEHRRRDYEEALRLVEQARAKTTDEDERAALAIRRERLERKRAASAQGGRK